jgi:hypothetical protein
MSSTTNARWHWRQWHNSDLERGHGQAPQEVVNSGYGWPTGQMADAMSSKSDGGRKKKG